MRPSRVNSGIKLKKNRREVIKIIWNTTIRQLAVLRFMPPRLRLSKFKPSSRRMDVSITILRRFSEKKLRISEGKFAILIMALNFDLMFLSHLIYSFSARYWNAQRFFIGWVWSDFKTFILILHLLQESARLLFKNN